MRKFSRVLVVMVIGFMFLLGASVCNAKEKKGKSESDEKVLFQDDFSDSDSTKSNWNIQSNWVVNDNGELDIDNMETGGIMTVGDESWTDYVFEAKFKVIERSEKDNHCGFHLRKGEDGSNFFVLLAPKGIQVLISADGKLKAHKSIDASKELTKDEWYSFKIVCKKQTIEVFINDESIKSISDGNINSKGGLDIWAYNCHIAVDDVKITEIETKKK